MADLFSGPNAPLAQAFAYCGWNVMAADYLLDPRLDFSDPSFQARIDPLLEQMDVICAAFDCSTKTRIREISRVFPDGRRAPGPLRAEDQPMGVDTLRGRDAERVQIDNAVCLRIQGPQCSCSS